VQATARRIRVFGKIEGVELSKRLVALTHACPP
jgi:hypothetical protein